MIRVWMLKIFPFIANFQSPWEAVSAGKRCSGSANRYMHSRIPPCCAVQPGKTACRMPGPRTYRLPIISNQGDEANAVYGANERSFPPKGI